MSMKTIGKKIKYSQTADRLLINISGQLEKKYVLLLALWLTLWTIAGIIVSSQLFGDAPREQKLIMAIFMAFWLYFEYRIFYVLRWRQSGIEILKLVDGNLSYSREINGKGKVQTFEAAQVRDIKVVDYSDRPFEKAFYKDFWSLGLEMVSFYVNGREHRVAMQLDEADARQLVKLLQKSLGK